MRTLRRELELIAETPHPADSPFPAQNRHGWFWRRLQSSPRQALPCSNAWLTEQEFANGFAPRPKSSRTAAGTVQLCGFKLRGWRGAAYPGRFILLRFDLIVWRSCSHLRYLPDMDRLFHGLDAAVVALVIVSAWRIGRNTLIKRWQWMVAVVACVVVAFFSATVIEVVLAAGLVGIFIDSFAEKQLQRLSRLPVVNSRRSAYCADDSAASSPARPRDTFCRRLFNPGNGGGESAKGGGG